MKISQMLSPMKISRVSPLLSAFLLPALLPLAAPQSARATDYYFDLVAFNYFGSQINLSQSFSYTDPETSQTRYFWFSDADMSTPLEALPDFSDPANNYIFNSKETYSSGTIATTSSTGSTFTPFSSLCRMTSGLDTASSYPSLRIFSISTEI